MQKGVRERGVHVARDDTLKKQKNIYQSAACVQSIGEQYISTLNIHFVNHSTVCVYVSRGVMRDFASEENSET